ncbi:hypothetical protein E2C01_063604 [Portunus trituberculatus]|uniref:Uncharacterized protein n=1 Tax=Portunus trituberculatus TaxID=210409 RepID=A0A5B7H9K9_PORTR|nr:hypothetical protein [Portunus trituberculatus]
MSVRYRVSQLCAVGQVFPGVVLPREVSRCYHLGGLHFDEQTEVNIEVKILTCVLLHLHIHHSHSAGYSGEHIKQHRWQDKVCCSQPSLPSGHLGAGNTTQVLASPTHTWSLVIQIQGKAV